MEPRGILRNKQEGQHSPHETTQGELDRQEVIRNTRYNAHLKSESAQGDKIRAQLAEAKHDDKLPDHLKWDEINLYKTEMEKAATMKIDEPKTPYEGGFNPEGEYYQEDDEAIPDFTLGESQPQEETVDQSLNGGELVKDEEQEEEPEEEEEEEQPLLAEERHRRFEEMRKKHYHHAAAPLKHGVDVDDEWVHSLDYGSCRIVITDRVE